MTAIGIILWLVLGDNDNNGDKQPCPDPDPIHNPLAVVWWRTITPDTLDGIGVSQCDETLLDFAYKQGVTEIFLNQHVVSWANYPSGAFGVNGQRYGLNPTRAFIRMASERDIRVYMYLGNDGNWLAGGGNFDAIIFGMISYQNQVEDDEKFAGLHFNIEPHQQSDFHQNRNMWQQLKIDFVENVVDTYGKYFPIDWTIPFWWNRDEGNPNQYGQTDLVTHRNVPNIPLYRAIMHESNRIAVMAYRNTAENMTNISSEVLQYAKILDIPVILMGTIIYSGGGANNQFAEAGNAEMMYQLSRLQYVVNQNFGNIKIIPAIHHIVTWYSK